MFYLRIWKNYANAHPILSFMFPFLTICLMGSGSQLENIQKYIDSHKAIEKDGAYFNVLLGKKENAARISRKLRELPGIQSVKIVSEDSIENKAKSILEQMDVSIDDSLVDLKSQGLKIHFETDTAARSMNLIRDYVKRLAGKNNVTIGPLQNNNQVKTKSFVFTDSLAYIIFGFLFFIWVGINIRFQKSIGPIIYLHSKFQRGKKHISLKLNFIVLMVSLLSVGVLQFFIQSFSPLEFSIAILLMILFQGPFIWQKTRWQRT